jgi:hypothetical protein
MTLELIKEYAKKLKNLKEDVKLDKAKELYKHKK